MEKLFHCNLHILVDGFVFKNGCTADIFLVYTNSPSIVSPEECQIQVRNSKRCWKLKITYSGGSGLE